VTVRLGQTEARNRVLFEVELDQHSRLITHNPGFMARFDDNNLRRDKIKGTAVIKKKPEVPPGQKPYMSMHAHVGLHQGLNVGRPSKAGRVNHAFNPAKARRDDIKLHTAYFAVVGALQRGEKGIYTHLGDLLLI
jgi:hypothetical protein